MLAHHDIQSWEIGNWIIQEDFWAVSPYFGKLGRIYILTRHDQYWSIQQFQTHDDPRFALEEGKWDICPRLEFDSWASDDDVHGCAGPLKDSSF